MTAADPPPPETSPLAGKRVALAGKLGGVSRREAQRLIREHGGVPVERPSAADLVILGAEESPLACEELLDTATRQAALEGRVEILPETQLWQRLGLVEHYQHVHHLYTPAMLADLLGVSVAVIRRWHRRGLIVPQRVVHRLPYFDFQEVATARRLAELLASGAAPQEIERKIAALVRLFPGVERPLAQLSVIVEGRHVLLRQGEGLIEPGGQYRFDFAALEAAAEGSPPDAVPDAVVPLAAALPDAPPATPAEMFDLAAELEEQGRLEAATELLRAALAAAGPSPEHCFHLAELLYRQGDLAGARERYYMAIELDEDYVEARANLGCVLAELGQRQLAVAAFEGALCFHDDYPDVHFHLARTLDELGRTDDAAVHWRAFLALAGNSPWAEEARSRLSDPEGG